MWTHDEKFYWNLPYRNFNAVSSNSALGKFATSFFIQMPRSIRFIKIELRRKGENNCDVYSWKKTNILELSPDDKIVKYLLNAFTDLPRKKNILQLLLSNFVGINSLIKAEKSHYLTLVYNALCGKIAFLRDRCINKANKQTRVFAGKDRWQIFS